MSLGLDTLRSLPLFEALNDDQLRWLAGAGSEVTVGGGTVLFRFGETPDDFYVLLDGELEIQRPVGNNEVFAVGSEVPGAWAGAVPTVDEVYGVTAVVPRASRLLKLPASAMRHMMESGFPIVSHLLMGVRAGTERFAAEVHQREKLAALGKLSAGLAHELNNPASAARRAAADLRALLAADAAGADLPGPQPALDPVARSDREEVVAAWLEAHGVADAWDLAAPLVEAGADVAWLDRFAAGSPAADLAATVTAMARRAAVDRLLGEIEHATGRISELVAAVKEYSYMDLAPMQEVDVHGGLENTITMLGHKLRDVEVTRDYDRSLPRIDAHGSQLNQVWTNLLDNAVDAMGGRGHIRIRTFVAGGDVVVEITDDGPGIPPDVQARVFDPFFTTKAPGQGTGLGLDTTYRIVVQDHRGTILLSSEPGATTFRIRLPVGGRSPVASGP
jgi:signal transduction histidine kinase